MLPKPARFTGHIAKTTSCCPLGTKCLAQEEEDAPCRVNRRGNAPKVSVLGVGEHPILTMTMARNSQLLSTLISQRVSHLGRLTFLAAVQTISRTSSLGAEPTFRIMTP